MARLSPILIFIASEKCVSMLSVPPQKGATAAAGAGGCGVVECCQSAGKISLVGRVGIRN